MATWACSCPATWSLPSRPAAKPRRSCACWPRSSAKATRSSPSAAICSRPWLQASDVALDCSVEREACSLNLAPTASTTAMLALGDALAVAVSLRKGFRAEDFAELHPGGKLGKQLAKVRDLMHTGEDVPVVAPKTPMTDVIYEMSSKKLGITTVQEDGRLRGVISDGDLRRLLEREGGAALSKTAGEAMNPHPRTIAAEELAAKALAILEERKITSLIVVDAEQRVEGVVHLHDLWGVELI